MPRRPLRAYAWQPVPKLRILHDPKVGFRRLDATLPLRVGAFATGSPIRILATKRGAKLSLGTPSRDRACSRPTARISSPRIEETLRRSGRKIDHARFAPRSHGETLPAAVAMIRGCRLADAAISSHRPVDGEDWGDKRHAPAAASGTRHRRGPVDGAGLGRIRPRANPLDAVRTRPQGIDRLRPSTDSPRAGGADPAGPSSKAPFRRAGRRRHDRNIVSQDGLFDAAPARLECGIHSGQEEGDELRQTDAAEDTPFWADGEDGRKVLVAGVAPGS